MTNLNVKARLFSINLNDIIRQLGEDRTKDILSSFECPKNKDVENFLRNKAIIFSNQGIARTHLVYWYSNTKEWGESKELVGYYTIAPKTIALYKKAVSKTLWKKVIKFGERNIKDNKCVFSVPLIGQLGKNFAKRNIKKGLTKTK